MQANKSGSIWTGCRLDKLDVLNQNADDLSCDEMKWKTLHCNTEEPEHRGLAVTACAVWNVLQGFSWIVPMGTTELHWGQQPVTAQLFMILKLTEN